ncbi:hypothetical protein BGZ79_009337 [Entomortierella chlamydospora]|nr:hypothetical protein BGZ79_009337 [Entomortierella chlamydospora]
MNDGELTAEVGKRLTRSSVKDRARGVGFDHVVTIMEPSHGAAASVPDDDLVLFVKALVGAVSLSRDCLRSASICASAHGSFAVNFSSWDSARNSLSTLDDQVSEESWTGLQQSQRGCSLATEGQHCRSYPAGARLPAVGTPRGRNFGYPCDRALGERLVNFEA